jgi:hypothetical protein
MPWVIDGNNVAAGRSRAVVRSAVLDLARRERLRILVIFDGAPPPGTGEVEHLGRVEIRYVPDADAAIIAFLRAAGVGWRLATDDRDLGRWASEVGADVAGGAEFWSKVEGKARPPTRPEPRQRIDVNGELRYFRDDSHRLEQGPRRVPRRGRKK